MKRMNFPGRRDQRRADAEARQEAYAKLTPKARLARAGAKERAKLRSGGN